MNPRFRSMRQDANKALTALTFVAFVLLLVRPVCDAYAAVAANGDARADATPHARHHSSALHDAPHAPSSEACCTVIAKGVVAVPFDVVSLVESEIEPPALAKSLAFPSFDSHHAASVRFARGAPPPRSYYARSARILR